MCLPAPPVCFSVCAKPFDHIAQLKLIDRLLCVPKGYTGLSVCAQPIKRPLLASMEGALLDSVTD